MMGSVTFKVLTMSSLPVLVYREPRTEFSKGEGTFPKASQAIAAR
jgi:hypothetical protein